MFYFRDLRLCHGLLLPNQHVPRMLSFGFLHIAIGASRVISSRSMSAELVLLYGTV
jgi:hypothetical protein